MVVVRPTVLLTVLPLIASAQFKSTVPLVIAPTTVTDSHNHNIDGLTADDLILYDNNVPKKIQLDWTAFPIDLVVAVQTSANSGAVIDKLGSSGILFTQLLAADAGETAMISFSDDVKLHQDFTADPDAVIHAMRMLRKEGDNAHALDALVAAATMLEHRPAGRRRIILMIGEKRDRSSKTKLPEAMEQIHRLNIAVYWLTYSPFQQVFTVKPKTAEDLKPEAKRIKVQQCAACPASNETPVPLDSPGDPIYAIGELIRMHKPDLAELFTKTTGGHPIGFLKKNGLEQAISLVAAEVHRQYILSFQPLPSEAGRFHSIRVAVKDRPDLHATTRSGYFAL
jgi:VWFA-related protein